MGGGGGGGGGETGSYELNVQLTLSGEKYVDGP